MSEQYDTGVVPFVIDDACTVLNGQNPYSTGALLN